jgi:hypothetical protein
MRQWCAPIIQTKTHFPPLVFCTAVNLYLGNNFLTGAIPSEIGECTNLMEVYLNDNLLNGTIPTTIGQLHLSK